MKFRQQAAVLAAAAALALMSSSAQAGYTNFGGVQAQDYALPTSAWPANGGTRP